LVFLAGLSCWQSHHLSYFPFLRCTENCPQLQLWLRGKDMPSLIFDKVSFSFVHYESCVMGIGTPPLSLNSQAHCRWNSLCVMILGLQSMSLSTKLEGYFRVLWAELSIWAVQGHFRVFGELILRQPSQQNCTFYRHPIPVQSLILPKCSQDIRK
jgi:hypothetical protein